MAKHANACVRQWLIFVDGDLPQDLEKLFADETALQQRGNDIDWTDIDRRLEEALQERLAPGPVSVEKKGNHKWLLHPQDGSERKTVFLLRLATQILLFPVTKSSARMLLRQCLAACRLQRPHMLSCLHVHSLDQVAKMTLTLPS